MNSEAREGERNASDISNRASLAAQAWNKQRRKGEESRNKKISETC